MKEEPAAAVEPDWLVTGPAGADLNSLLAEYSGGPGMI